MSLKNRVIGLAAIGAAALVTAAPLASAKPAATNPRALSVDTTQNALEVATPTLTDEVAQTTEAAANSCDAQAYSQVFKPFGDLNLYSLIPQGSFEGGTDGWTITGSGTVVADAGYPEGPAADTASLELSAGSTATSPLICANLQTPTLRLFAKALSKKADYYTVSFTYPASKGAGTYIARWLYPGTTWTASPQVYLMTNKINVDSGDWGYIRVSVTAPANSALRIDDLYLDPRMH